MVSLIVPVYNEEGAVAVFYREARRVLRDTGENIAILFVDDGSTDNTLAVIEELCHADSAISYLSFSRNFGKEAALMAGLEHAKGDAVIPIDVDLQDPLVVIPEMIAKWRAGSDVVIAKRTCRNADSLCKRLSAGLFYAFNNRISDHPIEPHAGDFRLLDRKVVEALKAMPERQLFMKGIFSWVGFETSIVSYQRAKRAAGKSKFRGWQLWNLALEGITSFSTWPLRVWTYLGAAIALLSFIYAVWMVIDKLVQGNPVPGYPSLLVAILFLGGVQLIGIGILGEYLGRVYYETKQRPRYIINKSNLKQ